MELRGWESRTALSFQDGRLWDRKGGEGSFLENVWQESIPRLNMEVTLRKKWNINDFSYFWISKFYLSFSSTFGDRSSFQTHSYEIFFKNP